MLRWRSPRLAAWIVVFTLALASNAFADAITIYNTGQGDDGQALPIGVLDPHYSLISAPPGVPLTAITTSPDPNWVGNQPTADWISPSANGEDSWPAGVYDYRTTFSLDGLNPATAKLYGQWSADNNACIYLNGANTGACLGMGDFRDLTAFLITSGFQPGTNTLDFLVTNQEYETGLLVEISGDAQSNTPEPGTLVTFGSGILAFAGLVRRKLNG